MVSDDPESFADLDGHDDLSYWAGKISAFVSDNLLGIGRVESSDSDFKAGQKVGDEAALAQGAFEITAGEVVKDSGEVMTLSLVGSEAGVTATGVGVLAELHGAATGSIAATHLMAERKEGQSSEPPQLSEGKKAHNEEPVRSGEKKEVTTPSGSGRMDRYDASKGHIREIKPNNARGKKSGNKQLDRYKKEMDKSTGKDHTTELTLYDKKKKPN
jgi:Restriction endonuclease fold toxin 9